MHAVLIGHQRHFVAIPNEARGQPVESLTARYHQEAAMCRCEVRVIDDLKVDVATQQLQVTVHGLGANVVDR